jgi:hypothetical protein
MTEVLADTFYYLALANAADEAQRRDRRPRSHRTEATMG